ncbi:hypothetical protein FRB95_000977 [Tulasnella sp. JGI-2019a]|nr:hypothetical protein FRB95_000977 [Tulasnella sp. JGI-2019a]
MKNPPPNAAPPPAAKREGSSEEEHLHPMSTSNSKDSGYSSGGGPSSFPTETVQAPFLGGRSVSDQTSRRTEATQKGSPSLTNVPTGLYFGSVDAIPATGPLVSPNTSSGLGFNHGIAQSMQPQYLTRHSDVPPYARGGASGIGKGRPMRRHGRTSSSLSSSYTRSSVRGGGADDEDEDEDDAMDEDNVGYLSPVSPTYGSATSGVGISGFGRLALSPDPSYGAGGGFGSSVDVVRIDNNATIGKRSGRGRVDELDFDVLYERDEIDGDGDGEDTVDEDGSAPADDREHAGGGAGMEIDMDL